MVRSALLLSILGAAACGAGRQHETLSDSIRTYNEGIRWERFEVAANAVPPTERTAWVQDMDERAEDVKVTDYDVVSVQRKAPREAHVQVKWSWYRNSEGTLHQTHADETWELHGKEWWMVDTKHVRGDEMPGVEKR
jgi:hypothetical protein